MLENIALKACHSPSGWKALPDAAGIVSPPPQDGQQVALRLPFCRPAAMRGAQDGQPGRLSLGRGGRPIRSLRHHGASAPCCPSPAGGCSGSLGARASPPGAAQRPQFAVAPRVPPAQPRPPAVCAWCLLACVCFPRQHGCL